ncbi:MAG TPA: sigma-70 family RNA polymerase sigma factor [Paludibacter sp.]
MIPTSIQNLNRLIIEKAFIEHKVHLTYFVYSRVHSLQQAEDIVQDTFLRVLEYDKAILTQTIRSLLFFIATNIVTDLMRSSIRRKMINDPDALFANEKSYNNVDSYIYTQELMNLETTFADRLSGKRKQVYLMSRFDDLSAHEIAQKLSISSRTAEGHLFTSRREIRSSIRLCI